MLISFLSSSLRRLLLASAAAAVEPAAGAAAAEVITEADDDVSEREVITEVALLARQTLAAGPTLCGSGLTTMSAAKAKCCRAAVLQCRCCTCTNQEQKD